MKFLRCVLFLLLTSGAALAAPTIELSAGMHRIEAEVASNNAERATGLMNRPSMPIHRGMLFVFPEAGAPDTITNGGFDIGRHAGAVIAVSGLQRPGQYRRVDICARISTVRTRLTRQHLPRNSSRHQEASSHAAADR